MWRLLVFTRTSPGEDHLSCSSPGEVLANTRISCFPPTPKFGISARSGSGRDGSTWCSPGEKHAFHQGKCSFLADWSSPGEEQYLLVNSWLDVMLRTELIKTTQIARIIKMERNDKMTKITKNNKEMNLVSFPREKPSRGKNRPASAGREATFQNK